MLKATQHRQFPEDNSIQYVHSTLLCCVFVSMNFLFDYAHNLTLDAPSWRFLRRHRLLLFLLFKALSMYCSSPINQPLWYSCVSTSRESVRKRDRGRETEQEETDSQDLDKPWEKRGLVEEKQKCLRTFLCDYTGLEKSRHSCSYSVS